MTDEPAPTDVVDDLVADWLSAAEKGNVVSPAEFCRDRPEVAAEFDRRLRAVRMVEALMPREGVAGETVDRVGPPSESETADAPAGYEILGELGRGGMGVVYKAHEVALNRLVALKVTRAGAFAGPRALARFRFEAEAAAGLDHPHIVALYGVGDGPAGPFLSMRWVDGVSLEERPPTDPTHIASLLAKVARAVHFAHQRGILHRDLKPANILVDSSGEPFVSDFGIARRLDSDATLTQAGTPVGTPAYMSPEQARGDTNLTVAADVYSLGVVLYQLLTDRLPYGGTVGEVLRQVLSTEGPPDPRKLKPNADPDLEAVCLKCLEKAPADRYRSAAELADDLERFARGEAVSARPPGFWDWVRQLAKTRPQKTTYSWQLLVWFGAIQLLTHAGVFAAAVAGGGIAWVWGTLAVGACALTVTLWWYQFRRLRHVPLDERHSAMIAAGHILAQTALLALLPTSGDAFAADALGYYPPLTALSGLGLFVLGSTHWGRFVPIAVGVIALVPLMVVWPITGPLLYGVAIAAVMWYWALALWREFDRA